jgi:hypothetical protein
MDGRVKPGHDAEFVGPRASTAHFHIRDSIFKQRTHEIVPGLFCGARSPSSLFPLCHERERSAGRRILVSHASFEGVHAPCDRCVRLPALHCGFSRRVLSWVPPSNPGRASWDVDDVPCPSPASSSQSIHSDARAESGAARVRGYEPRPRDAAPRSANQASLEDALR